MLTVSSWKWGRKFSALHVNVAAEALRRHLSIEHEFVCVTDDRTGIDRSIRTVPMPRQFAETPRCRRRMQQFSIEFIERHLGIRNLYMDLDLVITGDLTPIVNRPEPIVGWKVGHAGVYSGSFLLADAGVLEGAWQLFSTDPLGYPLSVQARGVPSDQAMVNHYIKTQQIPVGEWTESDGFVSFYGAGYERLEHLGVGPNRRELPSGARIVVLGSEDLDALEDDRYPWVRAHYLPLVAECRKREAA